MFFNAPTSKERSYSAAQAPDLPLPNLIVQLTPLVENGRLKADPYFPDVEGQTAQVDALAGHTGATALWIRLDKKTLEDGVRTSHLTLGKVGHAASSSETRSLVHVEYKGWGDHGVPSDPAHLANFARKVLELNASLSATAGEVEPAPIVVGCSAGVGRTGTFITIASLLGLVDEPSLTDAASARLDPVPDSATSGVLDITYPLDRITSMGVTPRDFVGLTIDGLREQRNSMVERVSQVQFCYEASPGARRGVRAQLV